MTEADEAHLTCPLGTDFRMDLRGRDGIADDGDLTAAGAFGNLPCGEGFISPLGGEGTIVAQTEPLTGRQEQPLRIEVQETVRYDRHLKRANAHRRHVTPPALVSAGDYRLMSG